MQLAVHCQYLVMSSAAFLTEVTQSFIDLLGLDDEWCVFLTVYITNRLF